MSSKCVVMFRCHHALLHRPSTPPRGVTHSSPRLRDATIGTLLLAAHSSQISRSSMWGIPIGLCCRWCVRYLFFCFEFSGACSVLINDFWVCVIFCDFCLDSERALFPLPRTHARRQAHLHTHASLPPLTVLFFYRTHTSLPLTAWTWKRCVDLGCIIIVR